MVITQPPSVSKPKSHTQASRKYGLYTHVHTQTSERRLAHTPPHVPAVSKQSVTGWRAHEYRVPATCCALQFQNKARGGQRTEGIIPHLCTLCIPNKDEYNSNFLKLRKSSIFGSWNPGSSLICSAWTNPRAGSMLCRPMYKEGNGECLLIWNVTCLQRWLDLCASIIRYVMLAYISMIKLHFPAMSCKFYLYCIM